MLHVRLFYLSQEISFYQESKLSELRKCEMFQKTKKWTKNGIIDQDFHVTQNLYLNTFQIGSLLFPSPCLVYYWHVKDLQILRSQSHVFYGPIEELQRIKLFYNIFIIPRPRGFIAKIGYWGYCFLHVTCWSSRCSILWVVTIFLKVSWTHGVFFMSLIAMLLIAILLIVVLLIPLVTTSIELDGVWWGTAGGQCCLKTHLLPLSTPGHNSGCMI